LFDIDIDPAVWNQYEMSSGRSALAVSSSSCHRLGSELDMLRQLGLRHHKTLGNPEFKQNRNAIDFALTKRHSEFQMTPSIFEERGEKQGNQKLVAHYPRAGKIRHTSHLKSFT
jgi:hypothetical protein